MRDFATLVPERPIGTHAYDIPPTLHLNPNPHLGDLVNLNPSQKEVHIPYSADITAGKNTYVYDAHAYHTKVPPQGIGLLIDHYTSPGDVVLDPFCGSGMTGVAAVERRRKAILCDLSPAATFIAYNLVVPAPPAAYLDAVRTVLRHAADLEHRLYDTVCDSCGSATPMLYMVWSYGMLCPYCKLEFVLWDVARDERSHVKESKIRSEFPCPNCDKMLLKRQLKRTQRYPVLVGYRCCQGGNKETTRPPSDRDRQVLKGIDNDGVPHHLWYPTDEFPLGVNTRQPVAAGITSIDKAYTPRALWSMASLWDMASRWPDPEIRSKLLFTLTSLYQRVTLFSEFRFWGGSGNTANYNVPAIINEQNVFRAFERKANTISWYFRDAPSMARSARISTQSACHLSQLPDKSVDYVFTDPPFGANINYSEMNFLWESWLQIHTDPTEEAIVNKFQEKDVNAYRMLLEDAFREVARVLKDNGWMTVIFHNSSAEIWRSLQGAVIGAGFQVIGTQNFDKQHGTFKQFVSDNAVGYDLVLHCRKNIAVQIPARNSRLHIQTHAIEFVKRAVSADSGRYVVRYLHVSRSDEFDYRRLYAEWLADVLPSTVVGLSFDEFRGLARDVLEQCFDEGSLTRPSGDLVIRER